MMKDIYLTLLRRENYEYYIRKPQTMMMVLNHYRDGSRKTVLNMHTSFSTFIIPLEKVRKSDHELLPKSPINYYCTVEEEIDPEEAWKDCPW